MTIRNKLRHYRSIPLAALLLTFVGFSVSAVTVQASTITFEDLGVGPNVCTIDDTNDGINNGINYGNYWNGSDGSGGFTSGGAFFNNSYSGAWSGFSYTNVNYTDTSVSDYTHQFAAVTGTGVGGSGNYVIGFNCSSCIDAGYGGSLPTVTIPTGMSVVSAMFTNTTYTVASMLHGDSFAKKFTSTDWLLLTITGENASGTSIGSVDFYLAKGTSIVTDWESIDLSSLASATTLVFDLSSSDSGLYGMNTPAYFAMDNLTLSAVPEPSTLALLCGAGVAGMFWSYRRRRFRRAASFSTMECC